MQSTPSNDFITIILRNLDGVTTIETENNSNLPTQEEVKKEEEEWKASIEKAKKEEDNHANMSWTACYDDECLVHMSEKDGKGWFPKQPKQQTPTALHADLPRDKCNRWGCQVPTHRAGKKSRTTSAERGGKKSKKPQQSEWDDTDSTVPDTTESLQEELMKLVTEQWELKETL